MTDERCMEELIRDILKTQNEDLKLSMKSLTDQVGKLTEQVTRIATIEERQRSGAADHQRQIDENREALKILTKKVDNLADLIVDLRISNSRTTTIISSAGVAISAMLTVLMNKFIGRI